MNTGEKITDIIRNKFIKSGLESKDICKKLGIKEADFLNCISGKRNFNCIEFLSVCNFLDLNFDDFKSCIC